MNSAAAAIALQDPRLVRKGNRGMLLNKAWEKVSAEGYNFIKGKSRSKMYGGSSSALESPTKQVKLSEEIRRQRMRELQEDIEGIDRHLSIKEKRLRQSEASHNYSVSDQFLNQIRSLRALGVRNRESSFSLKLRRNGQNGTKLPAQLAAQVGL